VQRLSHRPEANWFRLLMSKSLQPAPLIFHLPPNTCGSLVPLVAIFVAFGSLKLSGAISKHRPERTLHLQIIPAFTSATGRVGPRPRMIHQISEMARSPLLADDTTPSAQPAVPFSAAELVRSFPRGVPAMQSRWNEPEFAADTADFPFPDVRRLGLQVAGPGVDPFRGDPDKAVAQPDRHLPEPEVISCREKLLEAVAAGKAWGPSPRPPFCNGREVPPFTVPKDKNDPLSSRRRAVFDFSAGEPSTNALCDDPRFFRENLRPGHVRDTIGLYLLHFQFLSMLAFDIPGCFELNHVHRRLLPLMVVSLLSTTHGREYWVKLATSFGWSPSEWGWQALLALILWRLRKRGYDETMAYVDNFYQLLTDAATADRHKFRLLSLFKAWNIPLHEIQSGQIFSCLGWIFDFSDASSPLMTCPLDKFTAMCKDLARWHPRRRLSLKEVQRAVGIMQWLSHDFSIGRADVASLIHLRTQAERLQREATRKSGHPIRSSSILVEVTPRAAASLSMWQEFFPSWDRHCPLLLGFGPCASWHCLGRVDASTEDGAGGFIFDPDAVVVMGFSHMWSAEEKASAMVTHRTSSGILEAYGFVLWCRLFAPLCAKRRLLLELDSECAALALDGAYSPVERMMACVREARLLVARHGICFRARHVLGVKFNEIADLLSHGRIDAARCLVRLAFGRELSLVSSAGIL